MSEANGATSTEPNPAGGTTQTTDDGTKPGGEGGTPEGGTPAGESKQGEGDEGKKATEVTYEFEFPEGMKVDEAELGEFKAVAKELNLDAEAAKKLAGLRVKYAQAQAQAHTDTVAGWADTSKADKEFGGDKFEENVGVAKNALDTFGSDELRGFLKTTGLGNHPELIRAFYRVGKAISDDKFVKPGATTGAKSVADTIYG